VLVSIPDRDSGEWIRSAPRRHQAAAAEINALRQGRFKPLVKLLKYWNSNLPETIRAKSFMVETLATHLFRSVPFDTLESGLIFFWDFVATGSEAQDGSHGGISTACRSAYWESAFRTPPGRVQTRPLLYRQSVFEFLRQGTDSRDRLISAQSARSDETLRAHMTARFAPERADWRQR